MRCLLRIHLSTPDNHVIVLQLPPPPFFCQHSLLCSRTMFRRGFSSSSPSTLHLSPHTKGHELPPYVCGNWTFQDRKQKMAWVLLWWISPGRCVTRSSKTVASILWREKDLHTGTLSPQLFPACLSVCLSACLSVSTLTKALAALSWSESMSCATLIVLFLLGFCLSLVIFQGLQDEDSLVPRLGWR